MQELSPAAAVQTFRLERSLAQATLCDDMWNVMEKAIESNRLIGCGRVIKNPHGENSAVRQGITIGFMYQVMDLVVTHAEPTDELDALTIGMVS
jgi:hypothetical protein